MSRNPEIHVQIFPCDKADVFFFNNLSLFIVKNHPFMLSNIFKVFIFIFKLGKNKQLLKKNGLNYDTWNFMNFT